MLFHSCVHLIFIENLLCARHSACGCDKAGMGLPSESLHSRKAITKEMARKKYDVITGHEKCHKGTWKHSIKIVTRQGLPRSEGSQGRILQWGPEG